MAIKVARGQVTIIDQNDAVSLQAFIGSSQPLTQVFNKDTGAYAPSWAASPYLILTPSLFVSGKAAVDQISSVGNAATLTAGVKSGSAKWYKDGTVITSGQDSCTIGVPHEQYGEEVRAVILLKPGFEPSEALKDEILGFALANLAKFKIPRGIDFVDDLPRSMAGKVLRNKVRAPYWEGRARAI